MLKTARIVRKLILVAGLLALMITVFPNQMQPLWDWANGIGSHVGGGYLPDFATAHQWASLSLVGLVLGGMGYVLWRDRRFEILQAEHESQTGAKHLKEKVRDLEQQTARLQQECNEWQQKSERINQELISTLLKAKEFEVRHEYGQEDRSVLKEMRATYERLLQEKSQHEGFHSAVDLMVKVREPHQNGSAQIEEAKAEEIDGSSGHASLSFLK